MSLKDGRFIDANPSFCRLLDREIDQLIGTQWSVIAGLSDREEIKAKIKAFEGEMRQSLSCDLSITIDFEDDRVHDVVLITVQDFTEIETANLKAKWHADKLDAVLDAVPAAIWFLHDVDGQIFTANKVGRQWFENVSDPDSSFCEASGYSKNLASFCDASGRIVPSSDVPLQRAVRGEAVQNFEGQFNFKDGRTIDFFGNALPWVDENGAIRGAVSAYIDVSERKHAEARGHLLAREVDHRARNILAVVQAIIQLTKSTSVDDFRHGLMGRIDSLARAHNLLADGQWRGVDLRQLVEAEIAPYAVSKGGSPVISMSGPDMALTPGAAQALALTLHEWATNAAKYGALHTPRGKIRIDWNVAGEGGDCFRLCWSEYDSHPAVEPDEVGFGATLIRRSISEQLRGQLSYFWLSDGLKIDIRCPISNVTDVRPV